MWSEVTILLNLFLMFVVAVYFNIYELGLFGSADLRTFQIAEIYTGPIAAYQIQRIYATQKMTFYFCLRDSRVIFTLDESLPGILSVISNSSSELFEIGAERLTALLSNKIFLKRQT